MQNANYTRPLGSARIVIADDHPLFRSALRQMLSEQPDLEIVAEAEDGREAVELCRSLRPELVLMDLSMPKLDGLEATSQIKREFPDTIVLVLTAFEDPERLSEAVTAGASGYILKHASVPQITEAIRKALNGEPPLDQRVAMQLLQRLIGKAAKEEVADPPSQSPSEESPGPLLAEPLSSREIEVLRLIARGQTNQEIARNLLISASTVKKHIRHIITKLGASDRIQAVVLAIEHGLLTSSSSYKDK